MVRYRRCISTPQANQTPGMPFSSIPLANFLSHTVGKLFDHFTLVRTKGLRGRAPRSPPGYSIDGALPRYAPHSNSMHTVKARLLTKAEAAAYCNAKSLRTFDR